CGGGSSVGTRPVVSGCRQLGGECRPAREHQPSAGGGTGCRRLPHLDGDSQGGVVVPSAGRGAVGRQSAGTDGRQSEGTRRTNPPSRGGEEALSLCDRSHRGYL